MKSGRPLAALLCPLALVAIAAGYVFRWIYLRFPLPGPFIDPYDTYAQFVPNILYAAESLRTGGGLLWNAYQSCGQPFLGDIQTGILYPPHWLFFVVHHETALPTNVFLHLALTGIGAYALAREYGFGRAGAVSAGFALQLAGSTLALAVWSPTHIGPFAWIPVALLCAERVLSNPGVRSTTLLGAILALQLLPGFPQTVFFTCQIIALRTAWVLFVNHQPRPVAAIAGISSAIVLAGLLAAIQLMPAWELSQLSVRAGDLTPEQIGSGLQWVESLGELVRADELFSSLTLGYFLLYAAALLHPRLSSVVAFYLMVATLYVGLAFGPGTTLFDVYASLPAGSIFRDPTRFLWVSALALAVLTGAGVDAILSGCTASAPRSRWLLILALAPLAALRWHSSYPIGTLEIVGAAGLLGLLGAAWWLNRQRADEDFTPMKLAWIWPVLVGVTAYLCSDAPSQRPNPSIDLWRYHKAFNEVAHRRSPNDRIFVAGDKFDFALSAKAASLYRIPSSYDYQHQAPARYAEYFVMAHTAFGPMRSLDQELASVLADDLTRWVSLGHPQWFQWGTLRRFNRRLFDLTASRYLIIHPHIDTTRTVFDRGIPLRLLSDDGEVRIYENPSALPRAFFVPRAVVARDENVFTLLSDPKFDPRHTVVLTRNPAHAPPITDRSAAGVARIVQDDPELVRIEVTTTGAGLLVLADQYFPGWEATLNGEPALIRRANYTFRAVDVPRGTSEIVFRYEPRSFFLGRTISAATLALILIARLIDRNRAFFGFGGRSIRDSRCSS